MIIMVCYISRLHNEINCVEHWRNSRTVNNVKKQTPLLLQLLYFCDLTIESITDKKVEYDRESVLAPRKCHVHKKHWPLSITESS